MDWSASSPLATQVTELVLLAVQSDSSTPEVNWEDQQRINRFGRLNNQHHELQAEIKAKKARVSGPRRVQHRLGVVLIKLVFDFAGPTITYSRRSS